MGSSKDNYSDLFDDDFEVTYEEDPGLTLDMYSNARKTRTARTAFEDTDPDMAYADDGFDDFEDVDEDGDYEYEDRRRRRDSDAEKKSVFLYISFRIFESDTLSLLSITQPP